MLFFDKKKRERGMTLIELMVVVSVIFIISGVTWVNFRATGGIFELERGANLMAQNIRRSLEMTMAMVDVVPVASNCRTNIIPSNLIAYGVTINTGTSTYQRMAYIINASRTNPGFGNIVCEAEIERVAFERGIVQSIEIVSGGVTTTTSTLRIIFTPPHPRTFIGRISTSTVGGVVRWHSPFDSVVVTINISGTADTRRVRVNRAGLIEVI